MMNLRRPTHDLGDGPLRDAEILDDATAVNGGLHSMFYRGVLVATERGDLLAAVVRPPCNLWISAPVSLQIGRTVQVTDHRGTFALCFRSAVSSIESEGPLMRASITRPAEIYLLPGRIPEAWRGRHGARQPLTWPHTGDHALGGAGRRFMGPVGPGFAADSSVDAVFESYRRRLPARQRYAVDQDAGRAMVLPMGDHTERLVERLRAAMARQGTGTSNGSHVDGPLKAPSTAPSRHPPRDGRG